MSDQRQYIVAVDDGSRCVFTDDLDEAHELRDELTAELEAYGDNESTVHIYRLVD